MRSALLMIREHLNWWKIWIKRNRREHLLIRLWRRVWVDVARWNCCYLNIPRSGSAAISVSCRPLRILDRSPHCLLLTSLSSMLSWARKKQSADHSRRTDCTRCFGKKDSQTEWTRDPTLHKGRPHFGQRRRRLPSCACSGFLRVNRSVLQSDE